MEFAVSALLLLILLLPGFIFQAAYSKGFWSWNSPTSTRSLAEQIPSGVVWASVLHLIWVTVCVLVLKYPVNLRAVMMLILGSYGHDSVHFEETLNSVTDHPVLVFLYFTSLYIGSALLGYGGHKLVRHYELDKKWELLRFNNEWFYLLTGEIIECEKSLNDSGGIDELKEVFKTFGKVDGIYLSAVVRHGQDDYLYVGFISDFFFDKAGNLDAVVLREMGRRALWDDKVPDEIDDRYFKIEGDYFILRYSEMSTINIQYLFIKKMDPKTKETERYRKTRSC